jgi:hypothetical protein
MRVHEIDIDETLTEKFIFAALPGAHEGYNRMF